MPLLLQGPLEAPTGAQLNPTAANGGRSLRPPRLYVARGTQGDQIKPAVGLGWLYLNISGPRNLDPGCRKGPVKPLSAEGKAFFATATPRDKRKTRACDRRFF